MPLIFKRWIAILVLAIVAIIGFVLVRAAQAKDLQDFWTAGGVRYLAAFLIVVAVTIGLHYLIKLSSSEKDNRGLLAIIVGQDRRVSTSKLQVALWTYAVFFSLLLLLFFPLGLKTFTKQGLQAEYLVLLGSPAAAAVLAKTFTSTQVASGTTPKPAADEDPGLVDGAAQAISNDEGRTDLFDFQYFLFNVVALLYFFGTFLPQPQEGLPDLPQTLVALTGGAAAAYTTKKGLPTNIPVLTGVYPATAAPGEQILIRGKNLTVSSGAERSLRVSGRNLRQSRTEQGDVRIRGDNLVVKEGEGGPNQVRVRFGGRHEQTISLADVQPTATDEIKVSVPADAEPGKPAPVMVIRADGIATEELPLAVTSREPKITTVHPSDLDLDRHSEITITGVGFGERDERETGSKNAVMLDQAKLQLQTWAPREIRTKLPTREELMDGRSTLPDCVELVVQDRDGWMSQPKVLRLRAE